MSTYYLKKHIESFFLANITIGNISYTPESSQIRLRGLPTD